MNTTLNIILDNTQDMLLILPLFDELIFLDELVLYLPKYKSFLSLFEEHITVGELYIILLKLAY